MGPTESLPADAFWQDESFDFIKSEEFESLGIDPTDIPPGTVPARRHPSLLPSRFGGNAYGVGFFEAHDRLTPKEIQLLHSIRPEEPELIRKNYSSINRIYKNIGLLIRYTQLGKAYYLIPLSFVSGSLSQIKSKAEEISKVIHFHRGKYLQESHQIGILTNADDLIANDLSIRFKEHRFIIIDSFEKLRSTEETLDLVIIPRDIYGILFAGKFSPGEGKALSKRELDNYAHYLLGKVYNLLKPDGEIFVIANRHPLRTGQTIKVTFKTVQEEKNFQLFTHIFKTRKRYPAKTKSIQVNVFDFQKYLSGLYVEQEVLDRLLGQQDLETMRLEEISKLPYLNYPLKDGFSYDQNKAWPRLFPTYFHEIFLKPLSPDSVRAEWSKRFSTVGYNPDYMLIYLGQKKPQNTTFIKLKKDVMGSRLLGCPLSLMADYRDSFGYLIRTLDVLKRIKSGSISNLPDIFMERLKQPLENKKRRYSGLNDVLKLMSKTARLQRIGSYLNPNNIEGGKTKVLRNLETLSLFGFGYGELREIFLIVVGHTAMGRILSGKMNEKALKPVSDLARTYDTQQALNLLRYTRLMSMAETLASRRTEMSQMQLADLFDLYDAMVKVVTNREMDWDRLLDEETSSMGGIHHMIVRKILKMMNQFPYLDNWSELRRKGEMEKESLADFDDLKLAEIEDVIRLEVIIEDFENRFLRQDPLQLPIFYRRFLNIEFHGTVHIFENMESRLVFLLLWITVNLVRGDIINFNPILADVEPSQIGRHISKVEEESKAINTNYLGLDILRDFSDQVYTYGTSFILGTGFQLRARHATQALEIRYIDLDKDIGKLHDQATKLIGRRISQISVSELGEIEKLFSNVESFYQSHVRMVSRQEIQQGLPEKQKTWFKRTEELRDYLKHNLTQVIFHPETIHTDLERLYYHARSLLHFVLPEFLSLEDLKLSGKIYLRSPIIRNILTSTRKIQALIRKERGSFQDIQLLHKLAQREFGPMASGIVGLNESQIGALEDLVESISRNEELYDALIKSFIFRDVGYIPELKEKYRGQYHPADHAQAGAYFLKKEKIPLRYSENKKSQEYLLLLVKYHDLLHHMVRGEFSFYATKEVLEYKDKDFFNAFFVSSLIMFLAMREDLILEDLAAQQFKVANFCYQVIEGKSTIEDYMNNIYARRGHRFYALESYREKGLPEGVSPAGFLEKFPWQESEKEAYIRVGRRVYGLERMFRLRGVRYVSFSDLVKLMVKVPLRFIYLKRHYSGIGYATFERELFETQRIYNSFQELSDPMRHFMLEHLVEDDIRIFGFENVSAFLNYSNQNKLLLISLLGARKIDTKKPMVCLNFLNLAEKIEKRYESMNDALNQLSAEEIWQDRDRLKPFFKARHGIVLDRDDAKGILNVDFVDQTNVAQKVVHMKTINDVEHLKNYFHHGLISLRKTHFYTEDYEIELERSFYERLREITDLMLEQTRKQMNLLRDFEKIHNLVTDLLDRSLDIGFTEEQKHMLNDLYELRKDKLRQRKLGEIDRFLDGVRDLQDLKEYWDSIKWYLLTNRLYLGKEFENLIARKFDMKMEELAL
ncbi:hypothetical protein ACFL4N_07620 [Thermodesulfobacteriota bacterium]